MVNLYGPYFVLLVTAAAIGLWGRSDGLIIGMLLLLSVTGVLHTYQLVKDHYEERR